METESSVSLEPVQRTWKPTVAGILTIIAGSFNLIAGIVVAAVGEMVGPLVGFLGFGAFGAPLIALGIVSIVGGVFALQRRGWGMALAGTICSLPALWILAIPAIVFIALSKQEFK